MFKIDLFENYPSDQIVAADLIEPSKVMNIVFAGGTFGNFLRFICNKFSKRTADIKGDPFTSSGTSHNWEINQTGLVTRYHHSFIQKHPKEKNLPVCLILPSSQKHYLYLKKGQWYKGNDRKMSPDDLWSKPIGDLHSRYEDQVKNIIQLYKLKETSYYTWIPKFIIRDWYKLEFLQPLSNTYHYHWFETLKQHEWFARQKTYHLDLETFFNWDTFLVELKILDHHFGIDIDFDRQNEMKDIFDKGLSLDSIRQDANLVTNILDNQSDASLEGLDVSMQAYIYAEIEKRHPGIMAPLTNRFFRDGDEIRQFIEYYPNWYRQKNPNLP